VKKDHGGREKQERKGGANTRNDTANARMDKTISLSSWKREQFKRQEAQPVWHPKYNATIVQAIGGRPHGQVFSLPELRK